MQIGQVIARAGQFLVDMGNAIMYRENTMDEMLKIQFVCEVCTTRLVVERDESVWTFKHYCEGCQTDRIFLRDAVIPDPVSDQWLPDKPDSIYLFRAGGLYKIGISKDPKRRLHDLSILPTPVEFVWTVQMFDAQGLEKELHRTFREKHVRGEWFALDEADVEYIRNLSTQ